MTIVLLSWGDTLEGGTAGGPAESDPLRRPDNAGFMRRRCRFDAMVD